MLVEKWDIVSQELPLHLSLCFYVKGCSLRCDGCHSPELWCEKQGILLTEELLTKLLVKYSGYVDCVIFMGGEWTVELNYYLDVIRSKYELKTALFTGLNEAEVALDLKEKLDYLKVGRYVKELGGLSSKNTNQQLIEVKTNKILNFLYIGDE